MLIEVSKNNYRPHTKETEVNDEYKRFMEKVKESISLETMR